MTELTSRIIRAAKLDASLYEEVENDERAMGQATAVVVASSIAAGMGFVQKTGPIGLLIGLVAALAGWYIWAYLSYLIGTRLLPEPQTRADAGQMLRTIGFASAPGLLRVFGILPGLRDISLLIASVWMLAAMVMAVKVALDYESTMRAVGVCLIGWAVQFLLLILMVSLLSSG
jgi:hypothetical protein